MYDVSAFMKTLKQNSTMSYNCRSDHALVSYSTTVTPPSGADPRKHDVWMVVVRDAMCYNISIDERDVLMKRQNVIYPKAQKALKTMGENLRLARKRRKITSKMMAERANMSLMTLRSLERGEAQVSMANYMAVIACLGFQDDIAQVAANDILGRDLQDAAL